MTYSPISPNIETSFIKLTEYVSRNVHDLAIEKGFWNEDKSNNTAEKLALIHEEVSEALSAVRHGNGPSDHIPLFSGCEEEMADAVIRIMDLCQAKGWRLGEAIMAKTQFNASRAFRHGKAF